MNKIFEYILHKEDRRMVNKPQKHITMLTYNTNPNNNAI